jgi:hypothetical protein
MGKYLDDAKAMYNYARIELQQWRQSNDEILLRDAAEKTWGAVTLATNDLLESRGRRAPSGTGSRKSELNVLERGDRRFRAYRMLDRFSAMEANLHKDCFYDGDCRLPLVPDIIEDAREYLDDVALLAGGQRE